MNLTWYRYFQRNGGSNQILKRQTSRSHYGSKAPAVTITVFKYKNKIGKIVVKTVPYSVNVNVKNTFTSHIDKKKIDIFLDFFIFIHFHYLKMHRL
jgi:hypothetical protein